MQNTISKLNSIIPVIIFLASIIGFWFNIRNEMTAMNGQIALINNKLDTLIENHSNLLTTEKELDNKYDNLAYRVTKIEVKIN